MDITVTGRHVQISDRFRAILEEKLARVEHLAPRTRHIDVVVTHERSSAAKRQEKVEITCHDRGPVLRAEAHADDKYVALDLALEKLAERMRRAGDRKKVHHRRSEKGLRGLPGNVDAAMGPAGVEIHGGPDGADAQTNDAAEPKDPFGTQGEQVVAVREKVHTTSPMTLDQAVYSMELVGHDFFLFHDKDCDRPCVVYRRRGWEYGVLRLDVQSAAEGGSAGSDGDDRESGLGGRAPDLAAVSR